MKEHRDKQDKWKDMDALMRLGLLTLLHVLAFTQFVCVCVSVCVIAPKLARYCILL